jgi:imidazolonepropionase
MGAASADHCTQLTDAGIDTLAGSGTVATLLPGAEFSTRSPYPDARRLLDAGVPVALATDCNPGTSFTTSMPWCIAMAVREMHMTVAEALRAATRGGARALRRDGLGRIIVGGPADLVLLAAPSYLHLAYRPGVDLVAGVWRAGKRVTGGASGPAPDVRAGTGGVRSDRG